MQIKHNEAKGLDYSKLDDEDDIDGINIDKSVEIENEEYKQDEY